MSGGSETRPGGVWAGSWPLLEPTSERAGMPGQARLGSMRFHPNGAIQAVVFARDGKEVAAAGQFGGVAVWDAATGNLRRFGWSTGAASTWALSPDGKTLAGVTRGPVVHIWNVETYEEIRRWRRRTALEKTLRNRPDLLEGAALGEEDKKLLARIASEQAETNSKISVTGGQDRD